MANKATNIEDQISILNKKGMILDIPDEDVKKILLNIGYYRLGFYWCPFKDNNKGSDNFKPNTKFSNIVSLYYFDVNLRNILLKYTKRIEVDFRIKLIYYVSNYYKYDNVWFTNPKIMSSKFIDEFNKKYTLKILKRLINK